MEIPSEMPVMVLPNAILFPQAMLPLYIFEPRYRRMLADSLDTHRMFSVAMRKPGRSHEAPCPIAGLGVIRASVNNKDGTSHLILQGIARIELSETVRYKPYRVHRIKPLETKEEDSVMIDALAAKIRELVVERLKHDFNLAIPALKKLAQAKTGAEVDSLSIHALKRLATQLSEETEATDLADVVAGTLLEDSEQRQAILSAISLEARLKTLIHFLMAEGQRPRESNN